MVITYDPSAKQLGGRSGHRHTGTNNLSKGIKIITGLSMLLVVVLMFSMLPLSEWEERSPEQEYTKPAKAMRDVEVTPEHATLLYPLHKITFNDHTFFMTGHDSGEYMSKIHMSKGKFYETSVTEAVLRYQKQYGGDILDIGMNIGSISIPAAHFCQGCKVIGIEAIESNFWKAIANGNINGLSNLVQIHVALQDQPDVTSMKFDVNPANMGMSHKINPRSDKEVEVEEISVRATTLDNLRKNLGNVRVVKVDVEGSEFIAMNGGLKWLEESPPCVIIMEVDKIDLNVMTSLLEGKGFTKRSAQEESIQTVTPNAVFKSTKKECMQHH